MYGVVKGVYYQNQERLDELNNRIMSRNIPSEGLEQVYDPRPSHTRRVFMPIVDQLAFSKTPRQSKDAYNQHGQFNPGTSAPFSGYATFIDQETRLKNIFMPLT